MFTSFKRYLNNIIFLFSGLALVSCGGVVEYDRELVTTADGLPTWQDVANGAPLPPTPVPVTGTAPVFISFPKTKINEGELYSYSIEVADVDAGDQLIVRSNNLPSWLELYNEAANQSTVSTLVGTPNDEDVGTHKITLSVFDLSGLESKQSFDLVVVAKSLPVPAPTPIPTPTPAINRKPIANDSQVKTSEDEAVDFVLTAADPDDDKLNYVLVSEPKQGKITGTLPNARYTPNANFSGSDSFLFYVSDGELKSENATVSISISSVNDAPSALNSTAVTNKNKAIKVTMTASDVEAQPLTHSVVSNPKNGNLSNASGNVITYTPKANFVGTDSFVFRVNDGALDSNNATVSITVNQVNAAPVAKNTSASTDKNKAVRVSMAATDPEGQVLRYNIVSNPKNGSLSNASGSAITYTPKANFVGTDSFVFRANDATLNSNNATVSITVKQVNTAPIARNTTATTETNKAVRLIMAATDSEGHTLSYSIVSNPKNGRLSNATANAVTYTPNANFVGTDSFTFRAKDANLNSNVATVALTINNIVQPAKGTYRVLVDTDIGHDADDIQSLYRLIHYSDILKVEGIFASASMDSSANVALMKQWIKNVRVNDLRAKGYTQLMSEEALLASVRLGSSRLGAPASGRATPGSNHIINSVNAGKKQGDTRPLYILTWGPLTTVAQALYDDPSIAPYIRIYSIGSSNVTADLASRNFVFNFMQNKYKNLWWIENGSPIGNYKNTYVGVFSQGYQVGEWANSKFIGTNIRGHGAAGNVFPVAASGLQEGDSPSMLYLLSPIVGGVGNVNNPAAQSWGGQFVRHSQTTPNFYIDCCVERLQAQQTINKWRLQFLTDWKLRWDRYK